MPESRRLEPGYSKPEHGRGPGLQAKQANKALVHKGVFSKEEADKLPFGPSGAAAGSTPDLWRKVHTLQAWRIHPGRVEVRLIHWCLQRPWGRPLGSFPKLLFPKWGKCKDRAPCYKRNLNIGPRIDSNLGQSPLDFVTRTRAAGPCLLKPAPVPSWCYTELGQGYRSLALGRTSFLHFIAFSTKITWVVFFWFRIDIYIYKYVGLSIYIG